MEELDDLEAEFMGELGLIESARLTELPSNRIKGNVAKNLKFGSNVSPKKKLAQHDSANRDYHKDLKELALAEEIEEEELKVHIPKSPPTNHVQNI